MSWGPHDRRGALRPHGGEATAGWGVQGRGVKAPAGGRCVHRAGGQGPKVLGTHRHRTPAQGADGPAAEKVVTRSREQAAVSRARDPPYLRHAVVKAATVLSLSGHAA